MIQTTLFSLNTLSILYYYISIIIYLLNHIKNYELSFHLVENNVFTPRMYFLGNPLRKLRQANSKNVLTFNESSQVPTPQSDSLITALR